MNEPTNDELRIACAEAMGWKRVIGGVAEDQYTLWKRPDGTTTEYTPMALPAYDTDHNAALTLVEALAKEGWFCALQRDVWESGNWSCYLSTPRVDVFNQEATAPTLPLAICRAYLKVRSKL